MIVKREPQEITTWLVAFWPKAATPLVNKLVRGRFKHVSVFAFAPDARTWVWIDVALMGTRVQLLPDTQAAQLILGDWTKEAAVLQMPVQERNRIRIAPGFWCVTAVKHMLGLRSGALLPDALWRDCLANGAKVIFDGLSETEQAGP